MSKFRTLIGLCVLGLFSPTLFGGTGPTNATAGVWSYNLSAARQLASSTDRPLVVMFSNSSGACYWCTRFEREINSSDEWNAFAAEQQLAMASIDYAVNWDELYYQRVYSNYPAITGFPAFVIYGSSGTNMLDAYTYRTNFTYTASGFVAKMKELLTSKGYYLEQVDRWDPADNTAVGATILDFKPYTQSQYHDLNKTATDTADWFKFLYDRRYKYMLQPSATTYGFNAESTDNQITNIPVAFPTFITTNAPALTYSTNLVSLTTNVIEIISITTNVTVYAGTNGLPRLIHLVTNGFDSAATATTNLPPLFASSTSNAVSTLPSASVQVTTNGTLPELISPTLTLFNPTRQVALNMDGGPLGITNALPLTLMTNGCVFPPQGQILPYTNSYCFFRINQEITNTLNSVDAVVYQPPVTNRTVTTTISNLTEAVVTRRTFTNVWLLVTNSVPFEYPVGTLNFIVMSNRVVMSSTYVMTNKTVTPIKSVVTNDVVSTGTNYVTYFPDRTEYTLGYRTWAPGEVGFAVTNVQVSEAVTNVNLTVTRKNGTAGSVWLRYRFEDADNSTKGYEAQNGRDYKAVAGELYWGEGQTGSTNISVGLIQDLHPTWEGDERFAVVLEKQDGARFFQAPVIASNAVVTLKESAKKNPGTIGFSGYGPDEIVAPTNFPNALKPAVAVKEGASVTLWVSRVGGSNGVASARVMTVKGTAKAPADFEAVTNSFEWADNEIGAKFVTIQTLLRDGFNRDALFTVVLDKPTNATLATASSVSVTLRDETVASELDDTAASAATFGLALKAYTGFWFWEEGSATALRSEPLFARGQKAVLQLTLNGPGVLSFDWTMIDCAVTDTLVCSGGVLRGKDFATSGPSASVLVKPGRQTVVWTFTKAVLTDANSNAFVRLDNLKWQPMPKAENPSPVNNARTSSEDFSWDVPATNAVLFGLAFTADDVGGLDVINSVAAVSPPRARLTDVSWPSFDELWGGSPVNNQLYKWRVDTVYQDGTVALTNSGALWAFTAISPDYNGDTGTPGENEVLQGVRCDLGEITAADAALTYAITSGTLPPGLSLKPATGQITGVPATAGTWTFLLQATGIEGTTRIPYDTAQITLTVHPLGAFAGNYNGWLTTPGSALAYDGSATLSLTEAGKLTAKLISKGVTYTFNAAALDAYAGSVADPAVVMLTQTVTQVAASLGVSVRHTLGNVVINLDGTLGATGTVYTVQKNALGVASVTAVPYALELFRDAWKDPGMAAALEPFKGYYTVSLPVVADPPPAANAPCGSGYLTLTVATNGAAKLSGVLGDGKAWSLATTLLYTNAAEAADLQAYVYVYAQPAAYTVNGGLCGKLRITAGADVSLNTVDSDGAMQWWNAMPTSVLGATNTAPSGASGFLNAVGVYGGFYDTVMNLQTFYLCRSLTFDDDARFPATNSLPRDYDGVYGLSRYLLITNAENDLILMPFGMPVTVGAQTFSIAPKKIVRTAAGSTPGSAYDDIDLENSVNLGGLTLGLTRATGLLAGSFILNYERANAEGTFSQRTRSVPVKGVYTPLRPDTLASSPGIGVQGAGFYLIPDTGAYIDNTGRNRTYTFDWSFPFELNSVESNDTSWCDGTLLH